MSDILRNSKSNTLPHAERVSALNGSDSIVCVGWMAFVFVWVVVFYRDTASDMAGIWWRSDTFAHGLVVLPIFAWLVWQKRAVMAKHRPSGAPVFLVGTLLAGMGWLLGQIVSVASLAHASLTALLVSSLAAVLGLQAARVLAFPLLYLFFAVPVGEFMLPVLMRHTADITVEALRLTGIPVYQEEFHFVVPNGRWSVVEACSGLRYLVASLMVGALYAYLNYVSLRRRLLFMLVALAVPVVANWVRAYLTVMIGYHFGSEFVEGFIHIVYGWVFFGVVIALMFYIGSIWREERATCEGGVSMNVSNRLGQRTNYAVLAMMCALTAAFPLLYAKLDQPVSHHTVDVVLPAGQAEWKVVAPDAQERPPTFDGYRGDAFQVYEHASGTRVGLYVAYFEHQRPGYELIMHGNSITGREEFGRFRIETMPSTLSGHEMQHAAYRASLERIDVWGAYWVGGRLLTNDYLAKARLAIERISGESDASAAVLLLVVGEQGLAQKRDAASKFMRDVWPDMQLKLEVLRSERD